MYRFLELMYRMGRLTNESLHLYVDAGRMTQAQYDNITQDLKA